MFGGADLLVNNTGINPVHGPMVELDLDAARKIVEVNCLAALSWVQQVHRTWMAEHGGAVVNVSSVVGIRPAPGIGFYGASKAMLTHITQELAVELGPDIRVNAVAPAVVKTKFAAALYEGREEEAAAAYPLKRLGMPADIGGVVAFLLSDDAAWITGQVLVVDGGVTLTGGCLMPVVGQRVVVTGAGHGIGRALATRLAAEGAQVVVNDLDAAAATRVADDIGGHAVIGDAASEAGVTALVDAARHHLGGIDIWFANAGIDRGEGLQASEADWAAALDVNVLAHVRAARLLVPEWLERGAGRFVVTASAAGLLTMLGSPTYSVSKHAAVAFAEWLSATYRHRGVVVQAICPQGVRTRMLDNAGPPCRSCSATTPRLRPRRSPRRCGRRWPTTGSWCSRTPRWRGTTPTVLCRPTAGWLSMNKLQRRLEAKGITA
nr:hypothetical protein GCM10020092_079540 [Actinoplanes digitatis]